MPTLAFGSGEVVTIRNPCAGGATVVVGDAAIVVVMVVVGATVLAGGATVVVVVVVEGATTQRASGCNGWSTWLPAEKKRGSKPPSTAASTPICACAARVDDVVGRV